MNKRKNAVLADLLLGYAQKWSENQGNKWPSVPRGLEAVSDALGRDRNLTLRRKFCDKFAATVPDGIDIGMMGAAAFMVQGIDYLLHTLPATYTTERQTLGLVKGQIVRWSVQAFKSEPEQRDLFCDQVDDCAGYAAQAYEILRGC